MKDWIAAGIVVYVAYVSDAIANSDFRCIHMSLNFFWHTLLFPAKCVYIMIYEVTLNTTRLCYLSVKISECLCVFRIDTFYHLPENYYFITVLLLYFKYFSILCIEIFSKELL